MLSASLPATPLTDSPQAEVAERAGGERHFTPTAASAAPDALEVAKRAFRQSLYRGRDGDTEPALRALRELLAFDGIQEHLDEGLQQAAYTGQPELVAELLRAGASVVAKNNKGRSALHEAAMAGNISCARLLLSAGADPLSEGPHGHTMMTLAAGAGSVELMRLAFDLGAPLTPLPGHQNRPTLCAIWAKRASCLELAIELGADPIDPTAANYTLAHVAARDADAACVKVLMRAGALMSAKNNLGQTPLDLARGRARTPEVVALLESLELSESLPSGAASAPVRARI